MALQKITYILSLGSIPISSSPNAQKKVKQKSPDKGK